MEILASTTLASLAAGNDKKPRTFLTSRYPPKFQNYCIPFGDSDKHLLYSAVEIGKISLLMARRTNP